MRLDLARAVADAVLYEGYLLYPYRASSTKNQTRWQFGVLGPPGAENASLGEGSSMRMQCLLDAPDAPVEGGADELVVIHLRCLQLQQRQVYDAQGEPVHDLTVEQSSWTTWDEAVDQEITIRLSRPQLECGCAVPVSFPATEDHEEIFAADGTPAGHVVRRRWPLSARLSVSTVPLHGYTRLEVGVDNVRADPAVDKDDATRTSLLGAHLIVEAHGTAFVSLLEPPDEAVQAVAGCEQHRCWPVLAGAPGDTDLVLGSPIILYDHPEIAAESAGALFDATEIDEILTLRVMTMTDQEKREARATDPRALEIMDRCDAMSPADLQQMHGILRKPHTAEPLPQVPWPGASDVGNLQTPSLETDEVPWWDPEADAAVRPEVDAVVIDGVSVARGSLVRVHPSRRADAQDLFFADKVARVTAVLSDVDGGVHVALVLVDDPAAELHDWYGRYWYFAPEELEPLIEPSSDVPLQVTIPQREDSRS